MGARDRDFIERMDRHMEEMRRLHDGTLRAADRVEWASGAAEKASQRTEKAIADMGKWVLSVQKRVGRLEIAAAGLTAIGLTCSYLLKEKIKSILNLGA